VSTETPTRSQQSEAWRQAQEWVTKHDDQVRAMAMKRGLDVADARNEILVQLASRLIDLSESGKEVRAGLPGLVARDAVADLADRSSLRPPRGTRNDRRRRWVAEHGEPQTEDDRRALAAAVWAGSREAAPTDSDTLERVGGAGDGDLPAIEDADSAWWGAAAVACVADRRNLRALGEAARDVGERAVQRWLVEWQTTVLEPMAEPERAKLGRAVLARLGATAGVRSDQVAEWGRAQVLAEARHLADAELSAYRRQREWALRRQRGELPPPLPVAWDANGNGRLVFDDEPAVVATPRPKAEKVAKERQPVPAMVSLFDAFPEACSAALELRPA